MKGNDRESDNMDPKSNEGLVNVMREVENWIRVLENEFYYASIDKEQIVIQEARYQVGPWGHSKESVHCQSLSREVFNVYAHEKNDRVLDKVEVRVLVELEEKGDD